jgi:phytoene synthase
VPDPGTAPPTRDEHGENFPVASRLLPAALRPKILAFYRFVRTADDIADSPALTSAEKLARLDALEATAPVALAQVGAAEALTMMAAFRQDAVQARMADWAALEDYCTRSADPVGRMLLRLQGEDPAAIPAADALCTALQLLNHLQDLGPDRATIDRIYLPVPWMAEAGGEAAFFTAGNPLRRAVLDAALDRVEAKLEQAAILPHLLRSRLRLQARVTLALAWRLLARLRAADPLAGRVALNRQDFAAAFLGLLGPTPTEAGLVARRVGRAGSSFGRGMRVLTGERRRALFAVYAFCRTVDDIADSAMPAADKRRFLAAWRAKLVTPDCALSRELAWAAGRFALPAAEFRAMIAGMETDAAGPVGLHDEATLDLYCRRVAGSVGALAVRIFGAPGAEAWGLALGRTFQLVNILRDVEEDARIGRLYIPRTLLQSHGITATDPASILADPRFADCCAALAARAEAGFAAAERDLPGLNRRTLKPARVMMWGYRRLLTRMQAEGFAAPRPRIRLTPVEKLRMAWVALVA